MDDELLEIRPRRPRLVRWLSVLAIALVGIAATTYVVRRSAAGSTSRGSAAPPTIGMPIATVPAGKPVALPRPSQAGFPARTAAVVLGEVPPFASVERSDDAAAKGPWTLVVRRADGALGRHGAVITFPVPRPAWGHPVRVGNVFGRAVMAGVVWPIAGRHARIRGDLAQAELIRLALATHVVAGLPAIRPPSGYWIRLAAPYRSGSIHEIRYHASQLGGAAARLDGLIYTGLLAAGAGFEDRLYALAAGDAGMVHGRPAVAAVTVGARPTLAWEVAPGTVAYLGYSGSRPDRAVDVLRQLASQSRALCGKEWRASNPQHTQQFNDFG